MQPTSHQNNRVYLIDDDVLVRAGIRSLIDTQSPFEVIGENSDARAALDDIKKLRPDVVLLDITLPGLSGIDAIPAIRQAAPSTQVVMASHHLGSNMVQRALRAGAAGYIAKCASPEELTLAIECVLHGQRYVSPKVTGGLVGTLRGDTNAPEVTAQTDVLTGREREVFQLIAVGRANKEIAAMLHISLSTVKKHRENLQRKLDCHSAAELARLAIREGLLSV
jgi:DNA-binding NarL/FixJ family response regulator